MSSTVYYHRVEKGMIVQCPASICAVDVAKFTKEFDFQTRLSIHYLVSFTKPIVADEPLVCPECGSDCLTRNGKVYIKGEGWLP